jgi:hypothetical protein
MIFSPLALSQSFILLSHMVISFQHGFHHTEANRMLYKTDFIHASECTSVFSDTNWSKFQFSVPVPSCKSSLHLMLHFSDKSIIGISQGD